MNEARDLLAAGHLNEAIESLLAHVKQNPGDAPGRTFLFELSCLSGDWERAERQLDVIGHQSTQAQLGVMVYRANINAERERKRVFTEGVQPHFLREPPPYVDLLVDALRQVHDGKFAEARATLDRAEEERPAIVGQIDGKPFQDFRDYDDFTAPVLELIVKDKYVWLPLEQIKSMQITPPRQLRDMIWASARIEALDGTIGEVYMPSLYPLTTEASDDQVRLGRMTDWKKLGEDVGAGVGLRLFVVDGEERTMFETSPVQFITGKTEVANS
ncbi:MAG: avirulence locus temperature-dependent protein secretion protein [Blastocatellia bacterium]|nr:MAG: avirulence locus temperature-dependent protein secretion protein [Blastocatellia bacterium]